MATARRPDVGHLDGRGAATAAASSTSTSSPASTRRGSPPGASACSTVRTAPPDLSRGRRPPAGCSIAYRVDDWGTGFDADVTVRTTGEQPIRRLEARLRPAHGRLRLERHRRPGRPAPPRHQPLLGREHPGRRRRGFRRQCHGGRRRAGFLQPRRCPLRQGLNRAAPFAPGARRAGSAGTSRPRSPLLLLFPRSVNSAETSTSAAVAPSIPVVSGTAWGPGSPPRACPRSRRTTSGRPPPRTGARHGSSPTSADG